MSQPDPDALRAVESLNSRYETLAAENRQLSAELSARDRELAELREHVSSQPGAAPVSELILALAVELARAKDAATCYEELFHTYKDWWQSERADRELLEAVHAHATGTVSP